MEWSLRFTPRGISVAWSWYRWGNEKRYRLNDLNPEFGQTDISRDFMNTAFSLLSAFFVFVTLKNQGDNGIIYWVIAVVCWTIFLLHIKRGKEGRTMVKRKDGTYAFVLDHKDFDSEELASFLAELKKRIVQEQEESSSE